MLPVYKAPFFPSPSINSYIFCPERIILFSASCYIKNGMIEHIVCRSEAESVLAPNFICQEKK